MKKTLTKRAALSAVALVIALAIGLAISFSACDANTGNTSAADLLALSIGRQAAPMIPTAISSDQWEGKTLFNLFDYDEGAPGTVSFSSDAETTGVRVQARISDGARAQWGVGTRSSTPEEFFPTGVPATFDDDQYVYIRVVSSNGTNTRYYRFYARVLSPVSELAGIGIDGVDADMELSTAGATFDQGTMSSIYISEGQAAHAVVDAEPWDPTASVEFAKGGMVTLTAPPDFASENSFAFSDADILYVRVIAQNGEDTNYYRFRIYVGRAATIKKLELSGYDVVGKGMPAGWSATIAGAFGTADQTSEGFVVNAELDDPDGTYSFAKIGSANAAQPSAWTESSSTEPIYFAHGEALALEVKPKNPLGATMYYKVVINHLAANFEVHPKSAVYYATPEFNPDTTSIKRVISLKEPMDTPDVLEAVLDRDMPGASYQWYEANSWYGGYGFDADGRITLRKKGDDDTDENIPEGTFINGDWISEIGFTQVADPNYPTNHVPLYASNLDEKSNVSFFNGGNSGRYVVEGRAIPGASGTISGTNRTITYTPVINDKLPFISGWSSETHYYWVVVTQGSGTTALTATSARAAIITETAPRTGSIADTNGDNVPAKKHFILDLNTVTADGEVGIHSPARNTVAFPAKREGNYYIPVTLPADFDMLDYSIAVVQAKFFLADGTPWVQNWTQGDIGFADADQENIVLYYNLTNNNATLGLIADGKEPSGGGIQDRFSYLVVKAAGEKPPKRLPDMKAPTGNTGAAKHPIAASTADMQGWFCPFIELVEVRFEGPSQIDE